MTVQAMRLINNEDIIGEVTPDQYADEGLPINHIKIKKPAIIVMMQGQNGQPNLGMAEYLVFAEEGKKTMVINRDKILFQYTPSMELVNAYNQKFGSGLVLATSQPSFDLDKLLKM